MLRLGSGTDGPFNVTPLKDADVENSSMMQGREQGLVKPGQDTARIYATIIT